MYVSVIVTSIVTHKDWDFIAVAEPEVFQPEVKFCPRNGMATFVDSPPIDRPSCVPAPGPVLCSLQGTSSDFLCQLLSSKLWDFFDVIFFKFVSLSLLCKWLKKTSFENTSCFSWLILKISYFFLYNCINPILPSSLVKDMRFWQHVFCSQFFRFLSFFLTDNILKKNSNF